MITLSRTCIVSIFCRVNDFKGMIFGLQRIQLVVCSECTRPIFGRTSLKLMFLEAAASDGAAVAIALYYRRRRREFRSLNNSRIRLLTKRIVAYWVCQFLKRFNISIIIGVTLAQKQCRLDIRKLSFPQRAETYELNRLSADCVGASSVNIFKNKIDIYLRRAWYT